MTSSYGSRSPLSLSSSLSWEKKWSPKSSESESEKLFIILPKLSMLVIKRLNERRGVGMGSGRKAIMGPKGKGKGKSSNSM